MDRFDSRSLYDIYRVTIKMRDRLCGGIPKNKELLADAVRVHTGHDDAETERQIAELGEGVVDAIVEKSWNGFASEAVRGLYLPCFQVKAMFKEVASLERITVDKRGSKQILQHGTFVAKALDGGDRIYLGKLKPDGNDEGPVHVMTPQGPRTAIKRVDYVEGIDLSFELWVYATHPGETRHIGEDDVVDMLRLAQENGLGADRSQGKGCFDVTAFECVQKVALKAKAEPTTKPGARNAPKKKPAAVDQPS